MFAELSFSHELAADGVLPAIEVDQLLASGFPATYQAPLFRQLRSELVSTFFKSRELKEQLDIRHQLGLVAELDEEEELRSVRVSRALLAHAAARPLPELAVLLVAALVYHFPVQRPPSPIAVAHFQEAVIATVREAHPVLWGALSAPEGLSEVEAADTLAGLGEALLLHRFDFRLTRPEL